MMFRWFQQKPPGIWVLENYDVPPSLDQSLYNARQVTVNLLSKVGDKS